MTPDGVFLTSASKDGLPQLRNGKTGDWIGTFQGHKGAVWACVLNETAFVAATASADFTARVWNAVTGDEVQNFGHKHIVRSVGFERGQNATKIVTGGAERVIRVFDLSRPEDEAVMFPRLRDNVRRCMWSGIDNSSILVSYLDGEGVDVLDVRSGQVVKTVGGGRDDATPATENCKKGPVHSMELTHCMKYLVTAEEDRVTVRRSDTLEEVKTFPITEYAVEAASYFPEKKRFVAGGSDMWIHVYDFENGELIEHGRGHHGPVHCLRFAPEGDMFASGSEDGTIRLWKTT